MQGLFRYDGGFAKLFGKIADVACLSLLWFISSIPIITMGAGFCALYSTVYKVIRFDRAGLWSEYWTSFRQNFKQATISWLCLLAVYFLIGFSGLNAYALFEQGKLPTWILVMLGIVAAFVTMWACCLFPCISRFYNRLGNIAKNCMIIVLANIIPFVGILVLLVLAIVLMLGVPTGLIFAPVCCTCLGSLILEKVFRKYMSEEDIHNEDAENRGFIGGSQ